MDHNTLSDCLGWLFGRGALVVLTEAMFWLLGSEGSLRPVDAYHSVWAAGVAGRPACLMSDGAGVPVAIYAMSSNGRFWRLFSIQFQGEKE